jgi:hypothetical protein
MLSGHYVGCFDCCKSRFRILGEFPAIGLVLLLNQQVESGTVTLELL